MKISKNKTRFLGVTIYIYLSVFLGLILFGMNFLRRLTFKESILELFGGLDTLEYVWALIGYTAFFIIVTYIYISIIKKFTKDWFKWAMIIWTGILVVLFILYSIWAIF